MSAKQKANENPLKKAVTKAAKSAHGTSAQKIPSLGEDPVPYFGNTTESRMIGKHNTASLRFIGAQSVISQNWKQFLLESN